MTSHDRHHVVKYILDTKLDIKSIDKVKHLDCPHNYNGFHMTIMASLFNWTLTNVSIDVKCGSHCNYDVKCGGHCNYVGNLDASTDVSEFSYLVLII